jgi:hypothetical protein
VKVLGLPENVLDPELADVTTALDVVLMGKAAVSDGELNPAPSVATAEAATQVFGGGGAGTLVHSSMPEIEKFVACETVAPASAPLGVTVKLTLRVCGEPPCVAARMLLPAVLFATSNVTVPRPVLTPSRTRPSVAEHVVPPMLHVLPTAIFRPNKSIKSPVLSTTGSGNACAQPAGIQPMSSNPIVEM